MLSSKGKPLVTSHNDTDRFSQAAVWRLIKATLSNRFQARFLNISGLMRTIRRMVFTYIRRHVDR